MLQPCENHHEKGFIEAMLLQLDLHISSPCQLASKTTFHRWQEKSMKRKIRILFFIFFCILSVKTKSDNCPICLEEISDGSGTTLSRCSHIFHAACINQWIKIRRSCPCCKLEETQLTEAEKKEMEQLIRELNQKIINRIQFGVSSFKYMN